MPSGIVVFLTDQVITPPTKPGSLKRVKFNGKWFNYEYYDHKLYSEICSLDNIEKYGLQDFVSLSKEDKVKEVKAYIDKIWNDFFYRPPNLEEIELDEADIDHDDPMSPEYILTYYQPCIVKTQVDTRYNLKYLDTYRNQLPSVSKAAVEAIITRVLPKARVDAWINSKELLAIDLIYDPKSPPLIRTKGDTKEKMVYLNTYQKPAWYVHKAKPQFPEIFQDFLHYLFPRKECFRYVLDWIHYSLTARAQTYLYLCGGQGSGKNTLAFLLSKLHGPQNYSTPKSLKSNFNYYLKEKTFVFWDELTCKTHEQKNILKAIINDEIQVEGKFRDHEQIQLCASYMIANNSINALHLEPIDRRFSVPDITDNNLEYAKGNEFVEDLLHEINHPEAIAEFGKWLTQVYIPESKPLDAHQDTDRFEEIVIATARAGFSYTLDKILRKEANYYCYEEEKEEFESDRRRSIKYPAKPDFENFFRNVKLKSKNLISHMSKDGTKIFPRKEFQGKEGLSLV